MRERATSSFRDELQITIPFGRTLSILDEIWEIFLESTLAAPCADRPKSAVSTSMEGIAAAPSPTDSKTLLLLDKTPDVTLLFLHPPSALSPIASSDIEMYWTANPP